MAAACNHAQFTAECTECIAAVPAPVVPPLPRVIRRCVHNESTDAPCARCADLRAGEARLRAVARIPEILARTPSAADVLRALAHAHEYDARHSQERASAVGAGETQREHEQLAAESGAVAEVLRVVLEVGAPHTPTVARGETGEGVP